MKKTEGYLQSSQAYPKKTQSQLLDCNHAFAEQQPKIWVMNSNADVQLDENDSLIDKETSPYIWVAEYLKNEAGQSVYSCISNYASCAHRLSRATYNIRYTGVFWPLHNKHMSFVLGTIGIVIDILQ